MEFRHLRYFVAVAEEMSFTRAAQRLHISQPPLSQQIRDLEDELGFSLFERRSRSIMLTHAGKEFLHEARQVLEGADKLRQRAALRARGVLGLLTVGMISSMARPTLAAMLRTFQNDNPRINISLIVQSSRWQTEALIHGQIDVGFLRVTDDLSEVIEIQMVTREPMQLAVPSDHHFASRARVEWEELRTEPLILIEASVAGPRYYDAFFHKCWTAGFEPLIQQYAMNIATQVWLVSAGLGVAPITIIPDSHHLLGVSLVSLPEDAPVFETAIAWRRSDTSAALRKFVDFWKPMAPL